VAGFHPPNVSVLNPPSVPLPTLNTDSFPRTDLEQVMTEPSDWPARQSSDNPAAAERTPETLPSATRILSIASLVLAIGALVFFWTVAVGAILGVAAVATGVIARRQVRHDKAGKGGIALAGIVLGIAAVAVSATFVSISVYSGYEDFQHCIRGSGYPNYLCLKECPSFLDDLCRKQIGW
jgi:hypothetical protein